MKTALVVLTLGIVGGSSCARIQNWPATTTLTSAPLASYVTAEEAVTRLADTRCAREADCGNVGSALGYADVQTCRQAIADEIRTELGADPCARGVHETKLFECIGEARTELCNRPRHGASRLTSCSRSELCSF